MEVKGCRYKVNLICLPLQELEVILGMDWLSANRILIDCREKRLLFPNSEEPELLSSHRVMKELQDDAQCFMIFIHLEVEGEEMKFVIPMVQEFEDVFQMKYQGYLLVERWSSLSIWYEEPVQCQWLYTIWHRQSW